MALALVPAGADAGTTRLYQGSFGPPGDLGQTTRIAVDQSNGDVYVVSRSGTQVANTKVSRFDLNGAPKNFTAGPDSGTNTLTGFGDAVTDVAVDRSGGPLDGTVYVGLNGNAGDKVEVFATSGESRGTITDAGPLGGFLQPPKAIAVDQSNGALYLGEWGGGRVLRFAPNSPSGAIDDSDYAVTGIVPTGGPGGDTIIAVGSGSLYITSPYSGNLQDGGLVRKYPLSAFSIEVPTVAPDVLEAESSPVHAGMVAIDPKTGELYAGERNRVSVFSPDEELRYRFGASAYFGERSEGLAVKSAASGPAERVYLSDRDADSGAQVATFGPLTKAVVRTHLPVTSFGNDGSAGSVFKGLMRISFRDSPAALFALDGGVPGIYGFGASVPPAFSPLSIAASGFRPDFAVDNTALSSAGNVYYASESTDKLYGFDSTGAPLPGFPVDPVTTPGPPAGSPINLRGVEVDSEGGVWVANEASDRVLHYSSSGSYVGAVDVSAHGEPRSIAFSPGGDMYVAQQAGVWKYMAPSYGSAVLIEDKPGFAGISRVAVDPSTGDLYINYAWRIDIYGPDDKFIEEIGSPVAEDQRYVDIAVDPSTGNIYLSDEVTQQVRVFGPGLILPDLILGAASSVGETGATLNGSVGTQTVALDDCDFEYVSDAAFRVSGFGDLSSGGSAPCGSVPVDLDDHAVSAPVSGLTANTDYRFRIVATNENGTVETPDGGFTTLGPPLAETTGSPLRTTTTALLQGRVSPSNSPTSFHFEYGSEGPCSTSACASTEAVTAGSGNVYQLASTEISELQPDTTYHYRIVADNGQTAFGEDMIVTTRATEAPLSHGQLPGPPGSDRAYEQVTLPDTGGNPVNAGVAFSSDGNRAIYMTSGGNPSSPVGGFRSIFFSERAESAAHQGSWQSSAVMPPREELAGSNFNQPTGPDDLSSFTVTNFAVASTQRNLWRLSSSAPAQQLFEPAPPQEYGRWYVGSDDSTRVVTRLKGGSLDPAYPAATAKYNVYDVSDGTPKLASLLPGNVVSSCDVGSGTQAFGFDGEEGMDTRNWLSADGSLLFFPSCSNLYMRELDAEQTKLVSGPALSGDQCGPALVKSTADAAFFWTKTRLVAEDSNPAGCGDDSGDGDVYRYDIASGAQECVTCVVAGLDTDVYPGSFGSVSAMPESLAVAEDGSRLYFQSPNRLTPGAPTLAAGAAGNGSVYRVNVESGDVRWIAGPGAQVGDFAETGTSITPDGKAIVFRSNDASLNPLGEGSDNGGKFQYYRYDDSDRSLVCVSCPPDGSAAGRDIEARLLWGFPQVGANTTPLSDDGDFAFKTTEALLGADQNTTGVGQDPNSGTDLYEWRDGRLFLVTDGLTNWPDSEQPVLNGVSPSGRDVFFTAPIQYTQDALDAYNRLYDARVGGGFEFPPPPKPCPLEVCQGTPKGAPEEQASGTSNFSGTGNKPAAKKPASCRKGKVRRKGRCVAKKKPKRAQQQRANNDRRTPR